MWQEEEKEFVVEIFAKKFQYTAVICQYKCQAAHIAGTIYSRPFCLKFTFKRFFKILS